MAETKGMTIKEAAESLGVSVDTIRRRIKLGQIRAEKIEGIYGPQWVIDPNTLAETQRIYEAVPVKYNMSPERLETIIKDATRDAAKEGTTQAMEEVLKEINELKRQIEQLHKEQDQSKRSFIERLFNK